MKIMTISQPATTEVIQMKSNLRSSFNKNKLKINNDNQVYYNSERIDRDKFRKSRRRVFMKNSLYKVNFDTIGKFYVKEDNYEPKEQELYLFDIY